VSVVKFVHPFIYANKVIFLVNQRDKLLILIRILRGC